MDVSVLKSLAAAVAANADKLDLVLGAEPVTLEITLPAKEWRTFERNLASYNRASARMGVLNDA